MLIDRAVRLSLACSLAYVSPQSARNTDYAQRLAPQLRVTDAVEVPELRASATILEGPDEVVVAFRGSTAVRNYVSMFNLGLVPSELQGATAAAQGKVHRGYQEASLRLYSKLELALSDRKCARTTFVGHSYGGGTATLCALLHLAACSGEFDVVTFAGPRVGDQAFASHFDSLLGVSTTHLVHDRDPVLAQNQPLWDLLGFVHTGKLLRCSATEPRLLQADEERSLLPPINFADHALYLGTYMGPRGVGTGVDKGL